MSIQEMLSYDDVLIVPEYSAIPSRSEVDISTKLNTKSGKCIELKMPIIASPMDTVCESEMAGRLAAIGAVGVIHRFNSIATQHDLVKEAEKVFYSIGDGKVSNFNCGGAIGINGDYLERAYTLVKAGCNVICIDVANACSSQAISAAEEVRKIIPDDVHFIVGTIGSVNNFIYMPDSIIDSVRVGIGSGAACKTSVETGVGYNSFQGCFEINITPNVKSQHKKQYFADGGLRHPGDIAKAIACGCDAVILGSMLAGTKAAPGEKIDVDGKWMKSYRGMASASSQKDRGQSRIREEGVSMLIPYKGKVEKVISQIEHGLQSAFSYVNARNIKEFQKNARFVKVSHSSFLQSRPHHV
jgi:IMP dehydrogenase